MAGFDAQKGRIVSKINILMLSCYSNTVVSFHYALCKLL